MNYAGKGRHLPGHIDAAERAIADAEAMLVEARASVPPHIRVRVRTPVASSAARGLTELAEREDADVIAIGSAHGAARALGIEP